MSEPAVFVVIQDGHRTCYGDRWGAVLLHRELIWGPDAFVEWVQTKEIIDEFDGDTDNGVVVNLDKQKLTWRCEDDTLQLPRVEAAFCRLLQSAWPEFTVTQSGPGGPSLADAAGVMFDDAPTEDDDVLSGRSLR